MDQLSALTQIIVAASAVLAGGGFWTAISSRKKMRSDIKAQDVQTAEVYNKLASDWIDRLEKRIKDLESEITDLKQIIKGYELRVETLMKELGSHDYGI